MADIQSLTKKLAELHEENRQLKELLYGSFRIPWEWGLSPSQATILRCLLAQPEVPYEVIENAIYAGRTKPKDFKSVTRVHMRNLRLRLEPLNIEIKNRSGFGYYLEPSVRADLKKNLKGSK